MHRLHEQALYLVPAITYLNPHAHSHAAGEVRLAIYYVSQFTVKTYCFADGRCLFNQPQSVIYHWNQYGEVISKKCRSVRPSVRPSVRLSVSVCLSVSVSLCVSVCVSVCLSVSLSVSVCNANKKAYSSFIIDSRKIIRILDKRGWHPLQENEAVFSEK